METVRAYKDRQVPILRAIVPPFRWFVRGGSERRSSRCRLSTVKALVVLANQSRTYSFSDNVSLILGEAAPQPAPHTVSRIVSTQIIDAVLNMAPNNQKTEVVPPQKCGRTCLCPLIQKSYSLVLFVLAVLAAAHVVSEIVGGFTRVTCSTGHAGVSANSKLTLRVDHSMNPGQCCGEHRYWRSLS